MMWRARCRSRALHAKIGPNQAEHFVTAFLTSFHRMPAKPWAGLVPVALWRSRIGDPSTNLNPSGVLPALRGPFRSGLRLRILLVVILGVLPLYGLILYSASERKAQIRSRIEGDALASVEFAAFHEARFLERARRFLTNLAQLPQVRDSALRDRVGLFLADLLNLNPEHINLGIVDGHGRLLVDARSSKPGTDLSSEPFFIRARRKQQFVTAPYHFDPLTGSSAMTFAMPLQTDGELPGILFAQSSVDWVRELAHRHKFVEQSSALLVDGEGLVLFRYPDPDRWSGVSLAGESLIRAVLKKGEGTVELPGIDGAMRFQAFAPLGDRESPRGYIVSGYSIEAVHGPVHDALVRDLVILAVISAFSLALVWIFADLLVHRRIRRLAGVVRRLEREDLEARADEGGGDEISLFARMFNAMAGKLTKTIHDERRAHQELQTLVGMLPEGVMLFDSGGRILSMNNSAGRLLGNGALRSIGSLPSWFGIEARVRSFVGPVDEFETARDGRTLEHALARETSGSPTVWVFRDVSENRRLRAHVVHQSKLADLGLFAAGIAHEVGNPLSSISAMIELLQLKPASPEQAVQYAEIQSNVDRIDHIVRDVISFARPTPGRKVTTVNVLVEKALGIFRLHSKGKNMNVITAGCADTLNVEVEEDQIQQVLLNLLLNAADAGDGRGTIELGSDRRQDGACIWVKDSGRGIPEEDMKRLFVPFFTTKEPGQGTGLGLFVCAAILQAHGGRIDVDSSPGKGSVFTITLPEFRKEGILG